MNSLNEPVFNLNSIVLKSRTAGPYERLVLWFQGCNIGCQGCSNQELTKFEKKHLLPLNNLITIIKEAKKTHSIEGVTLLGGEPTLQKGLRELCQAIQTLNLGVILYTGKQYATLDKMILKYVDLVIDGPFLANRIDTERKGVGSTNQKVIPLSKRYEDDIGWFYACKSEGEFSLNEDDLEYTGDEIINI